MDPAALLQLVIEGKDRELAGKDRELVGKDREHALALCGNGSSRGVGGRR